MDRAALRDGVIEYIRVSTTDQANSPHNLQNQINECKAVTQSLRPTAVERFIDPGESGRSMDRPDFQRMLEFARKNKHQYGHIVIQDLSRLARNVEDQSFVLALFWKLGYKVHSRREPNLDSNATGKLSAGIIGCFNQYFSDNNAESGKARCSAALRNGRWPWRAPLGYLNVESGAGQPNIVPDAQTAPFIVRAFELVASGMKRAEVLRTLTLEGLKSRDGNPQLDLHTLSNLLRNTVYIGLVRSKKEGPYPGLHLPLVPKELFESVQDVLSGRRKKYVPHRKINPSFPLSAGIRCQCGTPLRGYTVKGKYRYYDCYSCKAVKTPAEKLELEFDKMLNRLHPQPEVKSQFPTVAARVWDKHNEDVEKSRKALTRQLESQQQLRDALLEKWLSGKLPDNLFEKYSADYGARIAAIEGELRCLEQSQASLEEFIKFAELSLVDMGRVWDGATAEERLKVRNLLFGDRLQVSPELQISNSGNVNLFSVLSEMNSQKIGDGAP